MISRESHIRVLCVDDHRIVRDGLVLIVNREPDLEIVASASSGEQALEFYRRYHPDITLMDLRLPRMSGIDAIRAIHNEDSFARMIVLTMYEGDEDIHRALQAGAAAYLLKDSLSEDLIRVIHEVHAGQRSLPPQIQERLAQRSLHPSLTVREIEVLKQMGQAQRNKEIAASLGIAEQTVQVHIRNIFAKLSVQDRIAAVNIARRRGIISDFS